MIQGISDAVTAGLGLSFTALGGYFLQEKTGFNLRAADKAFLFAFPVLYNLGTYLTLYQNGYFNLEKRGVYELFFYLHLKNPLNLALLILMLATGVLKDLKRPFAVFVFAYIIFFYAYIFYGQWAQTWLGKELRNFDTPTSREKNGPDGALPDTTLNLFQFYFIGPERDTSKLSATPGKFILLETWSETCLPCIKAMRELPDFYRSLQDKMDVYYVYEHPKEQVRQQFDRIFQFESIHQKSRIRIDLQQALYKAMNMEGLPCFLLFDSSGKLRYLQQGYPGKDAISQMIREKIAKHER